MNKFNTFAFLLLVSNMSFMSSIVFILVVIGLQKLV